MNLTDAESFMKKLLKTWESGSVDSLSDYYHNGFQGKSSDSFFDLKDLRKRFNYYQSRYCSMKNRLIAIDKLQENQFFTLSHFFALDTVFNQYSEIYVTNVIVLNLNKIQSLWSISSQEINRLRPEGESNEDPTLTSLQKEQHIMQLKQISQRGSKQLSARELDCLYYYIFDKTAKEIANYLHLSFRTVESHINNIKNKLGVTTKSQLIQIFNTLI